MGVRDKFDMTGKVVLVTGAAGHVARTIIPTLQELGATIIPTDQSIDGMPEAFMRDSMTPLANLSRWGDIVSVCQYVLEEFGRLDVLINNAAVTGATGLSGWAVPFDEQNVDSWERSFKVNLLAPMILSQRLAPLLAEGDGGVILNVSSIHGVGGPVWSTYEGSGMGCPAAYAAAKGGLVQLTKYLATTLAPKVRVNALTPGGIARGQPEEFVRRYVERVPLGRMETEDDLAGAIAFLCSDASAYMTGHNLIVDGGWCAW